MIYVREIRGNIRYLSKNICYLKRNILYLKDNMSYLKNNKKNNIWINSAPPPRENSFVTETEVILGTQYFQINKQGGARMISI